MIYKMTLLPLPYGSGRDRKKISEHSFSNLGMRHPLKPECELNHASLSPTFDLKSLKLRGPF